MRCNACKLRNAKRRDASARPPPPAAMPATMPQQLPGMQQAVAPTAEAEARATCTTSLPQGVQELPEAGVRVKLEEQPPPMPPDALVKLEFES